LTSYKDADGNEHNLSTPWVFYGDLSYCADNCADYCHYGMSGDNWQYGRFRTAMFDSIQSSPAMCEANVININWYNADSEDVSANNAGTATYGSDVRTPVKAQTIKGKTFKGWRFSKPQQTNLPE
jgi:hypothetical protein